MEQATLREKKSVVPSKTETPKTLLDYLVLEFSHVNYSGAGNVTRAGIGAQLGATQLMLGFGALKLDYYEPLFFLSPKIEVNKVLGDFEVYFEGGSPYVVRSKGAKGSLGENIALGGVWEPVKPGKNTPGLRLGSELRAMAEEVPGKLPQQTLFEAEFGASVSFGGIVVYSTEKIVFYPDTPYSQHAYDVVTPHHEKVKAGASLQLRETDVNIEVSQTPFAKGGEFSVKLKNAPWSPSVYGWVDLGGEMIGEAGGIGLRAEIGGERKIASLKVEKGAYEKGSAGDAGVRTRYGSKEELEADARGSEAYGIMREALRNSDNLDEFISYYKGKGDTYSLLYALSYIGEVGRRNYDEKLKNDWWNVFSNRADEVARIGPEGAFAAIQESFRHGNETFGGAGICANINVLPAVILRELGWEAYTISLAGGGMPHVVTAAKDPATGKMYLLNYRSISESKEGNLWPLLQEYAQNEGIVVQGAYLFGKNNEFLGYYKGREGKLMDEVAGKDEDSLRLRLIRPRKK